MAVGHIKAIALVYNQEKIVQESQTVRTGSPDQRFGTGLYGREYLIIKEEDHDEK